MAVIYKTYNIISLDGTVWRVDIDDNTYEGEVIAELNTSSPGFTLKYEGDTETIYGAPVRASSIDLLIEVGEDDTALDAWLQTVAYASEQQYTLLLYKNEVLEGVYPVLQDLNIFDDAMPYTFTLSGSDGLGKLKDIDFTWATTETDDTIRLGDALIEALKPCAIESFYEDTDPYIKSSLDWFELSQRKTNCALADSRVSRFALIKDIENNDPYTCYEIVEMLLNIFGARIQMTRGCWHVTQPDNYAIYTAFDIYAYPKTGFAGGKISSETFTCSLAANSTNKIIRSSGNYAFKPALNAAYVNYTTKSGYYFSKTDFNSYALTKTVGDISNFSTYGLRLKINLSYQVLRRTLNNITQQTGWARLGMQIYAGDYQLTINPNNTSEIYWTLDQDKAFVYDDFAATTDSRSIQDQITELLIPPVPDSSLTSIYFNIFVSEIGSACGADINWNGSFVVSQLNDNEEDENNYQYQSLNDNYPNSSAVLDLEVFFGDIDISFSPNALQIYTGSVWQQSVAWNIGKIAVTGYPLAQLLCNTAVTMQRKPVQIYQGTFLHGPLLNTLIAPAFNSKKYMFGAGTFSAETGECTGEWIEMNRTPSGISNSVKNRVLEPVGISPTAFDAVQKAVRDLTKIAGQVNTSLIDINTRLNAHQNDIAESQVNMFTAIQGMAANPDASTVQTIKLNYTTEGLPYFVAVDDLPG